MNFSIVRHKTAVASFLLAAVAMVGCSQHSAEEIACAKSALHPYELHSYTDIEPVLTSQINIETATEHCRVAVNTNPESITNQLRLIRVLLIEPTTFSEAWSKLLDVKFDNVPYAHYLRGIYVFNASQHSQSVEANYEKAEQHLLFAAENGITDAYLDLFDLYTDPENHQYSLASARKALQKGADLGSSEAQVSLARMFLLGINGFEKNIDKALKFSKLSAQQNNAGGELILGSIYQSMGELDNALDLFLRSANQGNVYAMWSLANLIEQAETLETYSEIKHKSHDYWLKKASSLGYHLANETYYIRYFKLLEEDKFNPSKAYTCDIETDVDDTEKYTLLFDPQTQIGEFIAVFNESAYCSQRGICPARGNKYLAFETPVKADPRQSANAVYMTFIEDEEQFLSNNERIITFDPDDLSIHYLRKNFKTSGLCSESAMPNLARLNEQDKLASLKRDKRDREFTQFNERYLDNLKTQSLKVARDNLGKIGESCATIENTEYVKWDIGYISNNVDRYSIINKLDNPIPAMTAILGVTCKNKVRGRTQTYYLQTIVGADYEYDMVRCRYADFLLDFPENSHEYVSGRKTERRIAELKRDCNFVRH